MIYPMVPYCPRHVGDGRNVGWAYNKHMEMLPSDSDWAFFFDHDMFLTTRDWYRALEAAVSRHPDAGYFTCSKWPTAALWSSPPALVDVHKHKHDRTEEGRERKKLWGQYRRQLVLHRGIGKQMSLEFKGKLYDVTKEKVQNGGIFLLRKGVWNEVGGFPEEGFKGVDHEFHRRVLASGRKVFLIKEVYLYHAKEQ